MTRDQVDELIHAINQLTKEVRKINADREKSAAEALATAKIKELIRGL